MISPIAPLTISENITGIAPIKQTDAVAAAETEKKAEGSGLFASVFQSAIRNVVETDAANTEAQYLLATGQLDNPAAALIASTKYQVAADMLIQMRNKALDAYSELIRMNI